MLTFLLGLTLIWFRNDFRLFTDALPIVGSAAFLAGGLWWKRRRAQAKANLDFLGVASEK
ncbi:MAG: hypothetical protein VKN60_10980 [Cyanobacteriota bacterium]|nr:hypothetical protein [Cyanobacteriota bacterium]